MINGSTFSKESDSPDRYKRLSIKLLQVPHAGESIDIFHPDCRANTLEILSVRHNIHLDPISEEFEQLEVVVFAKPIEVQG